MNLIGQSAVICLSFSGLCRMLLQLQCYQKPKQFKKCRIVVPQAQTLLASLIILVDLTMLILSDKLLLDIQLNHTFMPKMIHKPWMVSIRHTILHPTYYPRLFITPLNDERAQVAFGLLTNPLEFTTKCAKMSLYQDFFMHTF